MSCKINPNELMTTSKSNNGAIIPFSSGTDPVIVYNVLAVPQPITTPAIIIGQPSATASAFTIGSPVDLTNSSAFIYNVSKKGTFTSFNATFNILASLGMTYNGNMSITAAVYGATNGSNIFTPLNPEVQTVPLYFPAAISTYIPVGAYTSTVPVNTQVNVGDRLIVIFYYQNTGNGPQGIQGTMSATLKIV
jgi:hypothetical protein